MLVVCAARLGDVGTGRVGMQSIRDLLSERGLPHVDMGQQGHVEAWQAVDVPAPEVASGLQRASCGFWR